MARGKTRVVGYRYVGSIDLQTTEVILKRALAAGVVTQYDSNKSMDPTMDCVWFNGHPGKALRAVRDAVRRCIS